MISSFKFSMHGFKDKCNLRFKKKKKKRCSYSELRVVRTRDNQEQYFITQALQLPSLLPKLTQKSLQA